VVLCAWKNAADGDLRIEQKDLDGYVISLKHMVVNFEYKVKQQCWQYTVRSIITVTDTDSSVCFLSNSEVWKLTLVSTIPSNE
jgi:hypothetical protein